MDEVYKAKRAEARFKTPRVDGICLELYVTHWTKIKADLTHLLNVLFLNNHITTKQKEGILICLPKNQGSHSPPRLLPSHLPTDHKIQTAGTNYVPKTQAHTCRTASNRSILWSSGRSILDALATVRDVIVYHESTRTPLCLLSLDLSQAFDRVSHEYLFKVLPRYGSSNWFVERLQAMYDNLLASVQINGTLVGSIAIQSGIRQGCPLSMCLYALFLPPLVRYLEETLPGLQIERRHLKTTVLAMPMMLQYSSRIHQTSRPSDTPSIGTN